MDKYVLSPEAQQDRESIWRYIAQDNPAAADRIRKLFSDAFEKLAAYPHMGHTRRDLTHQSLRFWAIHSYLIVYKPEVEPLESVRILSGYRDIAEFL